MDNYFLKKINFDFKTQQKILGLISKIDSYKGKWNAIEKKETHYLKELRRIATIESIGSSTRIEGGTLSDAEIQTLLKNLKISELKTRDEQEVIGYYETLEQIYESYPEILLSENNIKHLHNHLLKFSDKDERHRGNYKMLSNKVVANYPEGIQKVIFNTTEVSLVEHEMQNLINFINDELKKNEIHPLILISIFIYELLSTHTFQDGNGRLSRLLTTLLLLQNDYVFLQYISLENAIEKSKKQYYNALMSGQKNRNTSKEIINDWLIYFLEKLFEITQKLENKYDVFKEKGGYINQRQNDILKFIEKNQPLKISDLDANFEKISRPTLKNDLKYLKEEKMIISVGIGIATTYILSEKIN